MLLNYVMSNDFDFYGTSPTKSGPKSLTIVCGLGMRLYIHMHSQVENGILHNGQQPQSVGNDFIDHGKFEVMKMLHE